MLARELVALAGALYGAGAPGAFSSDELSRRLPDARRRLQSAAEATAHDALPPLNP